MVAKSRLLELYASPFSRLENDGGLFCRTLPPTLLEFGQNEIHDRERVV